MSLDAAETSAVEWGTQTITYDIRRSARRKTVAVSVDANEGVVLTAPAGVSVERLDALVRGRGQWIVGKLRAIDNQAKAPKRELVSGESLLYLGRNHRLKLVEREATLPARMERGRLVVEVAPGLGKAAQTRAIRAALEGWYHGHATQQLEERVAQWAPQVGGGCAKDPRARARAHQALGQLRRQGGIALFMVDHSGARATGGLRRCP